MAVNSLTNMEMLKQREELTETFSNVLRQLATAELTPDNVEEALKGIKETPVSARKRLVKELTEAYVGRKEPSMTTTDVEIAMQRYERELVAEENRRQMDKQREENIQLARPAPEPQFIEVAPSNIAPLGAQAYHQPAPLPVIIDASVAADRHLNPVSRYYKKDGERYVWWDPKTLDIKPEPLQYPETPTLELFDHETSRIPSAKGAINLYSSLKKMLARANYLGLTNAQFQKILLSWIEKYFAHFHAGLQMHHDAIPFFRELCSYVSIEDNRTQVQAAIKNLSRNPGDPITSVTFMHKTLYIMMEEMNQSHLTSEQLEKKAERKVMNSIEQWLSEPARKEYKSAIKVMRDNGDVPSFLELNDLIMNIEAMDGCELQTVKHAGAGAHKLEIFKLERERDAGLNPVTTRSAGVTEHQSLYRWGDNITSPAKQGSRMFEGRRSRSKNRTGAQDFQRRPAYQGPRQEASAGQPRQRSGSSGRGWSGDRNRQRDRDRANEVYSTQVGGRTRREQSDWQSDNEENYERDVYTVAGGDSGRGAVARQRSTSWSRSGQRRQSGQRGSRPTETARRDGASGERNSGQRNRSASNEWGRETSRDRMLELQRLREENEELKRKYVSSAAKSSARLQTRRFQKN